MTEMKAKPASGRSTRRVAKVAAPSKTAAARKSTGLPARPAKAAAAKSRIKPLARRKSAGKAGPAKSAAAANKSTNRSAQPKSPKKTASVTKATVAKRSAKRSAQPKSPKNTGSVAKAAAVKSSAKRSSRPKSRKKNGPVAAPVAAQSKRSARPAALAKAPATVRRAAVKKVEVPPVPAKAATQTLTRGRVLVISGSDSSGASGIQADVKTITALGGYAMTALTALTAQNTEGVNGVIETPAGFIAKQMRLVLKDIGADVVKIGIVPSADAVEAVHYTYMEMAEGVPIVLDPVMLSDGGEPLVDREAIHLVRQHFLLHAQIVTPNIPEAEVLAGMEIRSLDDMKHAAEIMITLGSQAVLLKGGKFSGDKVYDVLYDENGIEVFEAKRVKTVHTHGAGCSLSSAIAVSLAQKLTLRDSVVRARDYVRTAILTAPGFGKGHGPLNHAHTVRLLHGGT